MPKNKVVMVKNPDKSAKIQYVVLVNPIGDKKFGYLHWDAKRTFTTRKAALAYKKKMMR